MRDQSALLSETYVWDQDKFGLGVEAIDRDHELLFRIVNKLLEISREETKDRKWAIKQSCTYFEEHALAHFRREEEYMDEIGYPSFAQHRRIHIDFRDYTLPTVKKELEQTDYSSDAMDHFIGVVAGWLIGHTLTEDQAIVGNATSKLSSTPDLDFQDAILDATMRIGEDMFHMNAQLVTSAYGGESFGQGVYYEQIFDTGFGSQKQSVIMVFEEKLLLSSMSSVLGVMSDRVETLLLHAVRYIARQYVRRVLEQFPDMVDYQLEADKMLTYEQFERIFEHYPMQASLLFNSGDGYLAFCMPELHTLETGVDVPATYETPLVEVDEYLKQREITESKPKILVVEDSSIVRHRLMEYLECDYDVALAASGPAAMRAVVLNRPNLILLSYDMKGWDGPTTLAQLAGYENIDDIPIVCIVDKSDKPTARKVQKLTPHGYVRTKVERADLLEKVASVLESVNDAPDVS